MEGNRPCSSASGTVSSSDAVPVAMAPAVCITAPATTATQGSLGGRGNGFLVAGVDLGRCVGSTAVCDAEEKAQAMNQGPADVAEDEAADALPRQHDQQAAVSKETTDVEASMKQEPADEAAAGGHESADIAAAVKQQEAADVAAGINTAHPGCAETESAPVRSTRTRLARKAKAESELVSQRVRKAPRRSVRKMAYHEMTPEQQAETIQKLLHGRKSVLAKMDLSRVLNDETFLLLPRDAQLALSTLLPGPDVCAARDPFKLHKVFRTSAMREGMELFQELLRAGEFDDEMCEKRRTRRSKLLAKQCDVWKARQWEPWYGAEIHVSGKALLTDMHLPESEEALLHNGSSPQHDQKRCVGPIVVVESDDGAASAGLHRGDPMVLD